MMGTNFSKNKKYGTEQIKIYTATIKLKDKTIGDALAALEALQTISKKKNVLIARIGKLWSSEQLQYKRTITIQKNKSGKTRKSRINAWNMMSLCSNNFELLLEQIVKIVGTIKLVAGAILTYI